MRRLPWNEALAYGLMLMMLAVPTWAQTPNPTVPAQRQPMNSGQLTAATNTAVVYTITGVTNARVRLMSFKARCSAGTSTVTITDGGTTVWSTTAGAIGTSDGGAVWMVPESRSVGGTVVVTLGACGVGNTGTLNVQADQW